MKPEISKLLLDNYFLSEIFVKANESFDAKQLMNLSANDITVESVAVKVAEDVRHWQVTLKVFYQCECAVFVPCRSRRFFLCC